MTGSWRRAGDAAWVTGGWAEAALDRDLARRMRQLGSVVRAAAGPAVRDVVPALASLTVHVDPLRFAQADLERLAQAASPGMPEEGRDVEVPVLYDGADLDEVAALAGVSRAQVVERHAGRAAEVLMLGFAPGFPYLAPVDPDLVVARRASPRVRVPAGTIGLAAGMTCIYPGGTAGGWHQLGRTSVRLFDATAAAPSALRPGDRVRFRAVARLEPASAPALAARSRTESPAGCTVLRPGALTTVQDRGRWGYQALGVPVSGACDTAALDRANRTAGNPVDAAALEVTLVGPHLRFERRAVIGWDGAVTEVWVGGRPLAPGVPCQVEAGDTVDIGVVRAGVRSYLAVRGGFDVPMVLGSRSTCLAGGFGGVAGRPLQAGDVLGWGRAAGDPVRLRARPVETPRGSLRVLTGADAPGNEGDVDALLERPLTVTARGNRVGIRLAGGGPGARCAGDGLPTGTAPGAIQVTPAGEAILLLADRQPTGGYRQVLNVIAADLDAAGQLVPGQEVRLRLVSQADALQALVAREQQWLHDA